MQMKPLVIASMLGLFSTISAAASSEEVIGIVKTIDAKSLTLETPNHETVTVLVAAKTKVIKNNSNTNLAGLTTGDHVVVRATRTRAGLKASEVAWEPPPVRRVQFSTTTAPQELFSMQVTFDPHAGFGAQPNPGRQMVPQAGFVFLFVKADVSAVHGEVVGGRDVYLIDAGGQKDSGYCEVDGTWANAEGSSRSFGEPRTAEFLFSVRKDRVVGSVFHFLDAGFRVSDVPSERVR